MREETAAFSEVVSRIDDAAEDVKFGPAQIEDAVRADDRIVIWIGSVVAEFFEARDERFAEIAAARDGAVAGLAGSQAARGTGVNQLARHRKQLRIWDWGLRIAEKRLTA